MTPKKDVDQMFPPEDIGSTLIDHESRLTKAETNMINLQGEFREIKDIITKGNDEQKEKLDKIDETLMEEFFNKGRTNRDNAWKLAIKVSGSLIGGGGLLYLVLEKFF